MIITKPLILADRSQVEELYSKNGYNYKVPVPNECLEDYKRAIAEFSRKYDFLAYDFHTEYLQPPYDWKDFLYFVENNIGLTVTVVFFENRTDAELSGAWHWDNDDMSSFTVYVNQNDSPQRQKMTILHECIHAIQDFDHEFKEMLSACPLPIQLRIADRIAEKAAVQIIMPREKVAVDKIDGLRPYQIALKYDVSLQMANYA